MKEYLEPTIEIIEIPSEDVITVSGIGNELPNDKI